MTTQSTLLEPVVAPAGRRVHKKRHALPILEMTWEVLSEIADTVGKLPAETGGAFGGLEDENRVSSFHFDVSSRNSAVTYSPDYNHLNHLFKTEWNPNGIRLKGFVHSHPGRMSRPSHGDEIYAERILKAIPDMKILWLPIVNTVHDTGSFLITPWAAVLDEGQVKIVRGALKIHGIPKGTRLFLAGLDASRLRSRRNVMRKLHIDGIAPKSICQRLASLVARFVSAPPDTLHLEGHSIASPADNPPDTTFDRVQAAYDLPRMASSRIVAVGTGGAAEWLEQLARAGIGQFVLIDPDTVSETNLATQQVYRHDIGRPKVDCIAERIRDINPSAKVSSIQRSLDDIKDDEFAQLASEPIDGKSASQTLLCGLTDNFFAQARMNRLALTLGLPSLSGQVYQEGRGCEITFTYPGVTPACHRCILSARYRYFLEQDRENPVTSHGTPIFATSRLNATKGFIALAILHHGSDHPRWGGMLTRIGERNLALVRMDPDFSTTIGMPTFDKVFAAADKERLLFDETLWLPQKPESPATGHPPCPDCGGTGDLCDSIGKIPHTDLRRAGHESRAKHAEDATQD
jgi:hypothetical protein